MKGKIYVVIVGILLCPVALSAAINDKDAERRLKHLEESRELLQKDFENKKEELDIALEKEKLKVEHELVLVKAELDNVKKERKKEYCIFWVITILAGGISSFTFIPWYIGKNKWIKKKLAEFFEAELVDNRKVLMEFIESKDKEIRFKEKYHIAVITADKADDMPVLYLLKEWGFKRITKCEQPVEKIDADVILLNYTGIVLPKREDPEGETHPNKRPIDETELLNMKSHFPETAIIFYLGPDRISAFDKDFKFRSWANTESQLYGNLMNALHYHNAIIKMKDVS